MRILEDWLLSYLDYTHELEAPELFHIWCAISGVATTLGRNVWLERGYGKLYPNHYIILVAKSALCRKSVSVFTIKDLLVRARSVEIMADRITNPSLLLRLHKTAQKTGKSEMLVFSEELAIFLSKEETHKGIIPTLTGLYGCPDSFINELKTVPIDVLNKVCLNILAATTPTDLTELIPATATGKGFTPRLHLVYQDKRRHKNSKPKLDQTLAEKLVADLVDIRKMEGPFVMSPNDEKWFDEWYNSIVPPQDENLDGFYGRKHDTMLKLAMVVAAGHSNELVIKKSDMQIAVKLLNQLESFMPMAYKEIGKLATTDHVERVLRQLKRRGGKATKSEILHDNWNSFNAKEWIEISYHMQEAELIEVIIGRPTTYKLKNWKEKGDGTL